jgi:hypothetical protein
MKRLLFAAARGARIQTIGFNEVWFDTMCVDFDDIDDYRIDPDDTHLQYGPISAALLDRVLLDDPDTEGFIAALKYLYARWPEFQARHFCSITEYEMTLLFLAEALADEGL